MVCLSIVSSMKKGAGWLGIKNVGDELDKGTTREQGRTAGINCSLRGGGKGRLSTRARQDWPTIDALIARDVRWQRRAAVMGNHDQHLVGQLCSSV